ncbi:MAG: hypothetical protein ACXAC5_00100 [Promethearchaeota archaeon]|jgi:hypothetical protein
MKELTKKQTERIEAIAAIADYITDKDVLDKSEVEDIESRLDKILASVDNSKKFFKRLL